MSEDDKDDEALDPQNPFAGTPMEQIFGAFAGGQMDMTQIMGQMQKMFAPHEGSVNFDLAKDVARHTAAAAGPDPTPNAAQQGALDDAVRLAESWLDRATPYASLSRGSTAPRAFLPARRRRPPGVGPSGSRRPLARGRHSSSRSPNTSSAP